MTNIISTPFTTRPTDADTHVSSDWQVATDSAFSNIVFESLADEVNLTSIEVSGLSGETAYFARVRHNGASLPTSDWSMLPDIPTGWTTEEDALVLTSGTFAPVFVNSITITAVEAVRSMLWNVDGSSLFLLDTVTGAPPVVRTYNASVPYRTSSLTVGTTQSLPSPTVSAYGVCWANDGNEIWISDNTDNNILRRFSTDVPYTFNNVILLQNLSMVSFGHNSIYSVAVHPTGTSFFIFDTNSSTTFKGISQYSLSVAFDLTSTVTRLTTTAHTMSVGGTSMSFTKVGDRIIHTSPTSDPIWELTLSTPWDLSTAADSGSSSISSTLANTNGGIIDDSDRYIYFTDFIGTDELHEFSTGYNV